MEHVRPWKLYFARGFLNLAVVDGLILEPAWVGWELGGRKSSAGALTSKESGVGIPKLPGPEDWLLIADLA